MILVIRHGETDSASWNRLCGSRTDEALNEKGKLQIKSLIPFLKRYPPDIIYTSSLLRAKQSCDIICSEFNVKSVIMEDLKEIDFGDWEGFSLSELESKNRIKFNEWMNTPHLFTPPGAESISNLCSRINKVLKDIPFSKFKNMYVVTHGGPIRAFLINLLEIPLSNYWRIKIPHGSVTGLEYTDKSSYLHFVGQRIFQNAKRSS